MISVVLPSNRGVIKNLKHFHCQHNVVEILETIDKISLSDVGLTINNSWNKVVPLTIAHCFKAVGFNLKNNTNRIVLFFFCKKQ